MIPRISRPRGTGLLLALGVSLALAACGSDDTQTGRMQYVGGVAKLAANAAMSPFRKKEPPPRVDPEGMAVSALQLNKAPLIFATIESMNYASVLGMTGENNGMRTYFTPAKQAIILRDGMLVGTRGLGFDLESADTTVAARLIRARQSGTAPMVLRYLDGLGEERPINLTCRITSTGKAVSYPFAGQSWTGTQVAQHCEGQGLSFDNSFVVGAGGQILSSRQLITPRLGHVTIQTVRP